jgi:hypothetical protein
MIMARNHEVPGENASGANRSPDRHWGGPGASDENADKPRPKQAKNPRPGEPTSGPRSRVSGGGGERDSHHTKDSRLK